MNNEKHTEEPWEVKGRGFAIYRQGYYITSTQGAEGTLKHIQDTNRANAERIVDCVNSCAGINPEAVPKMLEALRWMVLQCEGEKCGLNYFSEMTQYNDAIEAIALAGKESE